MIIGYVRVSTLLQKEEHQMKCMPEVEKFFIDKLSGRDMKRPQLKLLMDFAREGDTIVVHSMDRLARNVIDLRWLVNYFTNRKVAMRFIKEGMMFNGNETAMSTLLLNVMGSFAEFERSVMLERQKLGIELAKRKGVYNGRSPVLNESQVQQIKDQIHWGLQKTKIARNFRISRATLYKYLREDAKKKPVSSENGS